MSHPPAPTPAPASTPALGVLLVLAVLLTFLDGRLSTPVAEVGYLVVVLGAAAVAIRSVGRRVDAHGGLALLLAGGLLLNGVGDLVWGIDAAFRAVPEPSPADVAYLAGLGLMCAALLRAVSARGSWWDVDALVDVLTIGVVTVVVLWQTVLADTVADSDTSALGRTVLMAYPVLDAVLVGLVVRLLWHRAPSAWLGPTFAIGITCWLVADLAYLFSDAPLDDRWMDLGWMAGACLMAHGLAGRRRGRVPDARATVPVGRVLVAIVPLAVPTGLLLLEPRSAVEHWPVILGGTLVLVALALVRTLRLLRSEEEALAALTAARDDALAASQAKSEFLATMSHELRTPLNGVLGLTTLLLGSDLDATQRRYAEESLRAGQSLLEVVNDLLDYSRIADGDLRLEEGELDVRQVLDDARRVAVAAEGVDVHAVVESAVPEALRGDARRLRQVLLNLTSNAITFTERGEVRLEARCVATGDDRVEVRFEVRDTGTGIAEADLERMFEPFAQADSSSTRKHGGTGLGLTISRQLVEAMGGRLEATSRPGVGSTFWFTLPLLLDRGAPRRRPPRSRLLVRSLPRATPPRTALVVQADEIAQIVAEAMLSHLGFTVRVVTDSAAALEVLAEDHVDLLVVDALVDDAGELVPARVAGPPTIAVADDAAAHEHARALGFEVVVGSPLELEAVRVAVDRVLGGTETMTSLPSGP